MLLVQNPISKNIWNLHDDGKKSKQMMRNKYFEKLVSNVGRYRAGTEWRAHGGE